MVNTPTTLSEAIIAIAELHARSKWTEGQNNLLLAFLTQTPENIAAFRKFSNEAANTNHFQEEVKHVARILSGLPTGSSPETPTPPSGGKPYPGSNVIQFPKFPEDR
jgi:hypothetical protein